MSLYFIEGNESVDFTKVCAVRKNCSEYCQGVVVYLQGGHSVPLGAESSRSFVEAYREYMETMEGIFKRGMALDE